MQNIPVFWRDHFGTILIPKKIGDSIGFVKKIDSDTHPPRKIIVVKLLIKIIEPYDGVLENNENAGNKVRRLFASYLGDLKTCGLISDYTILSTNRESAITYDVAVQLSADRSAKKLKIHVGVFQEPWVSKK